MPVHTLTVEGNPNPIATFPPPNAPIADVEVWYRGQLLGTTDANGQIGISGSEGQQWTLVLWKPGWQIHLVGVRISFFDTSATIVFDFIPPAANAQWVEGGQFIVSVADTCYGNISAGDVSWRGYWLLGVSPASAGNFSYSYDWSRATEAPPLPTHYEESNSIGFINFANAPFHRSANIVRVAPGTSLWPDGYITVNYVLWDSADPDYPDSDLGVTGDAYRVVGGVGYNTHLLRWISPTTCPLDSGVTPPTIIGGGGGNDPTGSGLVSIDQLRDGRKLVARVSSAGAISVARYDTNFPDEAPESAVTVAATGGKAVSLRVRRSGIVDLLTVEGSTVYYRLSRDGGRTWSVASSVGSGQGCSLVVWEKRGLILAAAYESSASRWVLRVGTVGADGVTPTWSSANTIVTGARNAGQLHLDKNGILYFLYVTTGGTETLVFCRSLSKTGAGTWS